MSYNLILPGSKSESNRLLVLQRFFREIDLENLSAGDDTRAMQHALSSEEGTLDIGHAGTAMRFLTAYFAACPGRETTLTGSARMQQRPIGILVDALRALGADVTYLKNEGFPPLHIRGRVLRGGKLQLDAGLSSQYITALLLIAPSLPQGLHIRFDGTPTSLPYIRLTLGLLNRLGIETTLDKDCVTVCSATDFLVSPKFTIESDWSAASYFYSLLALSPIGSELRLQHFVRESLQGDAVVANLYRVFGVETFFEPDNTLHIIKKQSAQIGVGEWFRHNFTDIPDLAQTVAVTCTGLGINCELSGLHTLHIKETDRISALSNELSKLGAKPTTTAVSLTIPTAELRTASIDTYDDHRMAMAFAPLQAILPITINNPKVVSKSFPDFWELFSRARYRILSHK